MRNVLFITNDIYPNLNANSEITYRIGRALHEDKGYSVTILGYSRLGYINVNPPYIAQTVCMKSLSDYLNITDNTKGRFKRYCRFLSHPHSIRMMFSNKFHTDTCISSEYKQEIEKVLKANKFDCIIGFMSPKESLIALSEMDLDIPFIAYKLDPWSTHYQNIGNVQQEKLERKVDAKADKIIVTNILKDEYSNIYSDNEMSKLIAMEFPNIIKYEEVPKIEHFSENKIHCVFAGALYDDIRNPEYTFRLFSQMGENIVLHIIGPVYGEKTYSEYASDKIVFHGCVSSDEAMQYMQSADILVNIGNTVTNQMPSKILTYMSLGKPILNIAKTSKCPTIPYMGKYPLSCSIVEEDTLNQSKVDKIQSFIYNNCEKRLEFDDVKKLFAECTPEYVADKLDKIITEIS